MWVRKQIPQPPKRGTGNGAVQGFLSSVLRHSAFTRFVFPDTFYTNSGCPFLFFYFFFNWVRFNKHLQNSPLEYIKKLASWAALCFQRVQGIVFMFASLHCKAVSASSNCKWQVFLTHILQGPNSSHLLWWTGKPQLFQKKQRSNKAPQHPTHAFSKKGSFSLPTETQP